MISLEGGFDELPEFFCAAANAASNAATRASNSAHREQPLPCLFDSAIMAARYPRPQDSPKINQKTRGRLPISLYYSPQCTVLEQAFGEFNMSVMLKFDFFIIDVFQ